MFKDNTLLVLYTNNPLTSISMNNITIDNADNSSIINNMNESKLKTDKAPKIAWAFAIPYD